MAGLPGVIPVMPDTVHFSDCRFPPATMGTVNGFRTADTFIEKIRSSRFYHIPYLYGIFFRASPFFGPLHEFLFHGMYLVGALFRNQLDQIHTVPQTETTHFTGNLRQGFLIR